MIESLNLNTLLKGLFFGVLVLSLVFCSSFFDKRTKIVFCDVGQGDAAYIRVHNRIDVVIDAGPERKILNCLGRYMPFYDRTIELAILSHDQKDHFGGYEYLSDRYDIKQFIISPGQTNKAFKKLEKKLREKKIGIITVSKGTVISIAKDSFSFFWPRNNCIAPDDNDCSLIFLFQEGGFKALFTGDASASALNSSLNDAMKNVSILKIPHHGSKNGLTKKFLEFTSPDIAVISVGAHNSYGHPNHEVLDILQRSRTKIKRTDKDGDIIFRLTH